ncbi:uncharacterized protein TNCT_365601 [Trichonephila clavata]|uniref:Protein ZIP4 homolog n=1 Tax=Trichonephila clavata TaxID=2740835 RepID=A0A8X6L942_TRICU|nr:uncharacterized protein TNCT_365601 [Trichonephila clavata]
MCLDLHYVEIMSNINKFDEICEELQKIQKRLLDFPTYCEYFVLLCYNISIKLYKKEEYEHAITILEIAIQTEKNVSQSSYDRFAILKLLTHIFLIYKPEYYWQKCLKVISLWKKEDMPESILLTSLKVAFFSNNQHTVQGILNSFTEIEGVSIFLISNTVQELEKYEYDRIATDFLKSMRDRMVEIGNKLFLMSLELKIYFKINCLEKANTLIEDAIKLVKFQDTTPKQSNSLCRVILTYTNDLLKVKSFTQCLTWCKKLLKFSELSKIHDVAFHQLQQRICLSYLEMNENESAKQTFAEMDWSESGTDSLQAYLALRIAIQSEDEELADMALKYLEQMDWSESGTDSLQAYLALRIAIQSEDEELADMALKYLGNNSDGFENIVLACCKKAVSSGTEAFAGRILESVLQKFNIAEGRISHLKLLQSLTKLHLGKAGKRKK